MKLIVSVSAKCTEVLMSAMTVDAPMSENCVLQLCASSSGCMLGSGTVDVNLGDVVPPGAALDLGPQVNPPQAVSARCANPPMSEAACALSLLRPASSVDGLLVNESASVCDGQPSHSPKWQVTPSVCWPPCGIVGTFRIAFTCHSGVVKFLSITPTSGLP